MEDPKNFNSQTRSVYLLVILFLISLSLIGVVFYNMPDLEEGEREAIKLPRYPNTLYFILVFTQQAIQVIIRIFNLSAIRLRI